MKTYLVNKKAYRNYEVVEKYEAGIKLFGHEVKSIREGHGSLKGSYIKEQKNQIILSGFDLPKYSKMGDLFEYDSRRDRIILLNSREKTAIADSIKQKGYTAIPLKIYTNHNLLKVLVGIGRGKKKANIKEALINRTSELEAKRQLKLHNQKFW